MAVAQFSFMTPPNPTEAALKWVETARKSSKAWTDGWLQIIATFSEVAQTQAKTLKSLTPSMAASAMVPAEVLPAPVEMLSEPVEVVEKVIEAASAPMMAPPLVETPPAPIPAPAEAKIETPPASVAKEVVEAAPAPSPVAKAKVEPALAPAKPPVAKVKVEPVAAPTPVVKAKAAPAAKSSAKITKPAAKKTT